MRFMGLFELHTRKSSFCGRKTSVYTSNIKKNAPKHGVPALVGRDGGIKDMARIKPALERQGATAGHINGLSGDPARAGTCQKRNHIGDIVCLADALQGLLAKREGFTIWRPHELRHIGIDYAGGDDVDGDAARSELNGQ